jgi:hypothetical protein
MRQSADPKLLPAGGPGSLGVLQIGHFSLILAAGLLYGLYYYLTDSQDYYRTWVDLLILISGFVVPIVALLYCVIFGDAADLRKKIIETYRGLLLATPFLLVTNVLLLLACVFLAYLALSYRSVTITVGDRANLYLNDTVGSVDLIGEWAGGQSRTVRMRVGNHHVVAKQPIDGSLIASMSVDVKSPWQQCECDRISLKANRDPFRRVDQ